MTFSENEPDVREYIWPIWQALFTIVVVQLEEGSEKTLISEEGALSFIYEKAG